MADRNFNYAVLGIVALVAVFALFNSNDGGFLSGATHASGVTECNDGIDNDGDGRIDSAVGKPFSGDPGCTGPFDTSEWQAGRDCDDGKDSNRDSDTDVDLDDLGCVGVDDTSEIDGQCDNKFDDDADGYIDYPNDPQCVSRAGAESSCTDTDGFNIYVAGSGSSGFGKSVITGTDECVNSISLREYYCASGRLVNKVVDCDSYYPNAKKCVSGACV